jgi:plasmid rolling circle replication initiator protein Rep
LDYKPIVDIRTVKQRSEGQTPVEAAMELGKYAAKDTDYIHESDTKLTDKVTSVLATALKNRRLIGWGKLFRKLHRELNLQDVEGDSADLVGKDEKTCVCPICESNLREYLYKWHLGLRTYIAED